MILRVPDYYFDFNCIADRCKDSCCIGWEIDIDEDTCDYYRQVEGALGQRLKKYLYKTPEGENSFRLALHGRCPFLNECNLCDIYGELGEEALSEVCTEYPRFAVEYGNVLQKCLSLSCEEVGRLVFSHQSPIEILEVEQPDYEEAELVEDDLMEDDLMEDDLPEDTPLEDVWLEETPIEDDMPEDDRPEDDLPDDMDEEDWFNHMEQIQIHAMEILHNREESIEERMKEYLFFMTAGQYGPQEQENEETQDSYEDFCRRFDPFCEMETLDREWRQVKDSFARYYSEESYEEILAEFKRSSDYQERDYEHLMVYFTFRYLMNAVYDYDVASYAKLAVVFTLVVRDMDALRYHLNGGHFSREDRIDTARIFSKEVEHSQDNVELAREAFLFEDIFSVPALCRQL